MFNKTLRLSKHLGFTLIDLAIIIAIVGILAAIAVPKFVNISGDAQSAATNGIAGALATAAAQNYAVRTEKATNGAPVTNCTDVGGLLADGTLPTGYTITSQTIAANTSATCNLTGPGNTTATFSATGTP